jgi:DNA repair protein RadC
VAEKPREKLLAHGASSLSDAELLAIFLRTGVKGCHGVDLARQLLASFGSISAIYQSNLHDFCQHHGLGAAKYVQLQACLEMSKRYLSEQLHNGAALTSSIDTQNFLKAELRHENREIFALLLLNTQHQVIKFKRLFYGTINAAAVYPRVVVETALNYQAAAVIIAHNHPSGIAEPSIADNQITDRLVHSLALIDVKVLDHIIVAGCHCYSYAEHGQLNEH